MRVVPAKLVEFYGVVPLELIGAMCSPTVLICSYVKNENPAISFRITLYVIGGLMREFSILIMFWTDYIDLS